MNPKLHFCHEISYLRRLTRRRGGSVTDPAKMRVLKTALMLQAISQHPVGGDMSREDDREMNGEERSSCKACEAQQDGCYPAVQGIVAPGAHAWTDKIAEHGKIGSEDKQEENPPAAIGKMIGCERRKQQHCIFGSEQEFHFLSLARS